MNAKQETALRALVGRYNGLWNDSLFLPAGNLLGLPEGYVAGWVPDSNGKDRIFVGCSPEGEIHS